MSELAQQIISDLKAFSADLLDRGLSDDAGASPRVASARVGGTAGTQSAILSMVGSLTMLTPRLLTELEQLVGTRDLRVSSTRTPVRARLSRRASDFLRHGDRILPRQWETLVPGTRIDPRPLRWFLHLLNKQRERLRENTERVAKSVAEARASLQGQSAWAEADSRSLEALLDRLQRAEIALDRAEHTVRRIIPHRITPKAKRPDPYPNSPAWASLRRLAARVERPEDFLPEYLQTLWGSVTESASLAHLYERWVGVRILDVLAGLGWNLRTDPVGAIFLGGRLTFHKGEHSFDLWVQPRLTRGGAHPSGWIAARGEEVTPDYLFVTPGPGGPSAFVLDATLRTGDDALREKSRYAHLVQYGTLVRIAGAPVVRSPELAWAAAPLPAGHNKILDHHGTAGCVPMNPLSFRKTGIQSYLRWMTRHVVAWAHENQLERRPVKRPPPRRVTVSGPLSVKAKPLNDPSSS